MIIVLSFEKVIKGSIRAFIVIGFTVLLNYGQPKASLLATLRITYDIMSQRSVFKNTDCKPGPY